MQIKHFLRKLFASEISFDFEGLGMDTEPSPEIIGFSGLGLKMEARGKQKASFSAKKAVILDEYELVLTES